MCFVYKGYGIVVIYIKVKVEHFKTKFQILKIEEFFTSLQNFLIVHNG